MEEVTSGHEESGDYLSVYLSDDVRNRVKAIAAQERRSFRFVVEELLVKGLEALENSGNPQKK